MSEDGSRSSLAEGCPSNTAQAGTAAQCVGCPGAEMCRSLVATPDPDQEIIDVRMKAIRHKILVVSGKGGVGKSSMAAGLAIALAKQGKKVGLVDIDICGPSAPKLFNVEGGQIVQSDYGWLPLKSPYGDVKVLSLGNVIPDSTNAVIWRGPRKTAMIKRFLKDTLWGRLDYLLFDTPPGTSDEHLTAVKLLQSVNPDGAVIVTTPQKVALGTIRREVTFCRTMNLPILGLVENMSGFVCPCCKEVTSIFPQINVADEIGLPVLGSVPLDHEFVAAWEKNQDPFVTCSDSPAVTAVRQMAQTLDEQLEN